MSRVFYLWCFFSFLYIPAIYYFLCLFLIEKNICHFWEILTLSAKNHTYFIKQLTGYFFFPQVFVVLLRQHHHFRFRWCPVFKSYAPALHCGDNLVYIRCPLLRGVPLQIVLLFHHEPLFYFLAA